MSASFPLEVVTPEGSLYRGQVQSVVLPGLDGQFGILAHHAPLLAALGTGEMDLVFENGQRHRYAIGEGFVEVSKDGTRVLTDFSDESGDIDMARAKEAELRARERLAHREEKVDSARAEAALRRALIRIRVATGR